MTERVSGKHPLVFRKGDKSRTVQPFENLPYGSHRPYPPLTLGFPNLSTLYLYDMIATSSLPLKAKSDSSIEVDVVRLPKYWE